MGAAQRCFDISELAEAIAQLSAPEIADPFDRGFGFTVPRRRLADVVALARTCRSMFYTCIPIIWCRLTGLDVLLECLPAHLWELVPVNLKAKRGRSRPPQLRLLYDPNGSDWDRYDLYAQHVKILHLRGGLGQRCLKFRLWQALYDFKQSGLRPLLPSLSELVWVDPPHAYNKKIRATYMSIFASPSLTSLHFSTPPGEDVCSDLRRLHRHFPNLRTLCIQLMSDQDHCWYTLEDSLISLSATLERFELGSSSRAPSTIMGYIAELPHLRVFKCNTRGVWFSSPHLKDSEDTKVPINALEVLHIEDVHGWPDPGWEHIFESYSFPSMRSLRILTNPPQPAAVAPGLTIVSALPSTVSPLTLRELHISEFLTRSNGLILHADHLHLLKVFSNLTKLILSPLKEVAWDDEMLTDFVAAFPCLCVLRIKYPPASILSFLSIPRTSPTLSGLASVIRLCPHLQELSLGIDAKVIPSIDEGLRRSSNNRLQTIDLVIAIPSEDYDALARFFYALLPNLRHIRSSSQEQIPLLWREVEDRLGKLAGVDLYE